MLTPTQILAKSSNIGALKIGLQLGEPALYATFRRFGFGEPTGVPLPGEASGVLRPKGRAWFDAETASASFGQGISVTTLQLAMAMSAIANGGRLLEPILVKKVTDGRGETVRESSVARAARGRAAGGRADRGRDADGRDRRRGHRPSRRPSPASASPARRRPRRRSTRRRASTRRRSTRRSFVGFVPVDQPRLVVAVVLDEPIDRPLRRRPRGPGLPPRRRGEPALPRRHARRRARPRSRRSSARATRPTPRSR